MFLSDSFTFKVDGLTLPIAPLGRMIDFVLQGP